MGKVELLDPSSAAFRSHHSILTNLLLLLLLIPAAAAHHDAGISATSPFEGMYAWGDSLTDTGNALLYQLSLNIDAPLGGHLPYGQTFFHYPTGRISDGRIVVDFLAKRVKAPAFLAPYLGLNGTEISLVNFAVGGATALNVDYLNATYNISAPISYSIDKQLQWFSTLPVSKDKKTFSKALVYFGQIGVNDYNVASKKGISIKRIITEFVPAVVKVIQNALEFLIKKGAKYLVIEGGYPIGCTPYYTNATTNQYGCVEHLQRLNAVHDKLLKQVVHNLTIKYNQHVDIVFFDQSKAYTELLKHPSLYGFTNTTDACFDNLTTVVACSRPSTYLNWDDIHFTEAANRALFNLFFTKGFASPYPNFLTSKSF
ncbi:hypothetical protein L7F22_012665 [Adiantum nelumboides]|nr:hypothetical protein [Adiantum nelumboides]